MLRRPTKIVSAEKYIIHYLEGIGRKVFSEAELAKILDENRLKWGLPVTVYAPKLVHRFVDRGLFKQVSFEINSNKVDRFFFKDPSVYEIAVSLRTKSYISHYPALLINELTNQIPKTIYITHELSLKEKKPYSITQNAIDAAFSKPQRRSGLNTIYDDYLIVLLEGKYTNRAGVVTQNAISYTNLERTLIDSTVRPNYSGSSFSVLEAYRNAINRGVSINKLMSLLHKMSFIYPYHQAIGFYFERAGYQGKLLGMLKEMPMNFNFYLDYDIKDKEYCSTWKVYYPKGM